MSKLASLGVWVLFFITGVLAYLVMRPSPREVAFAAAPEGGAVAFVTERRCVEGACQTLWAGPDRGSAEELAALEPGRSVDEVVWLPDGKRVAFLVDGYQLRLYAWTCVQGAAYGRPNGWQPGNGPEP